MKIFVVGLVVVLCCGSGYARLAPVLTACSSGDPDFEKCVKAVVERIRPAIAAGNYGEGQPKAPPLEPISIDQMAIDRGAGFRCKLSDVKIAGAGDFTMRRVKLNKGEKMFNVSVRIPTMLVKGQYELDMQILVLKISGRGDFSLDLNNTLCNMQLKYFFKDDSTVQFQPIAVKLKFDKARFQLQNLFNGDPTLGRVGNEAINQDPHVLLGEVKPAFEESLGKYFTDIANAAVAGASEQEILPP
ncbi:conserved hypothetical protein [Culex quinquefasciatus]|uniref:Hemolymph juvenile hormone binding protein n=1 Tax=Culex quinquefasciatus TaxID=7176 RepID=B0X3U5_CULQU|nr:uncharacterized protein LOC6047233 [Culex quinquefasciatus]EDS40022.1 conserved hypothetical protein [Culex quinquefasciatus]|eukprot:XP_001864317.1 conserved hypothetical protein [Culex quinquefasciatus]